MNKVLLLGNVCQEPEIKEFSNGGKVAQFSLATTKRGFKTKNGTEIPDKTDFHRLVINNTGLIGVAEKYIHKGDKLYIEGEVHYREYITKEKETKHITEIAVSSLELLGSKPKQESAPAPTEHQKELAKDFVQKMGGEPVCGDLPF